MGSVFIVALVMITLNILVDRQGGTTASAEPAKFLERLPLKLRGAEVWAVEAEDHYLRLHTSKGQDLILMRLADAIAGAGGDRGRPGAPLLVGGPRRHRRRQARRRPRDPDAEGRRRGRRSAAPMPAHLRERGWI